MGNDLGRVMHSQFQYILMQLCQTLFVLYQINGCRDKLLACIHVTDMDSCIHIGQGKGVLGLMVLGHIG